MNKELELLESRLSTLEVLNSGTIKEIRYHIEGLKAKEAKESQQDVECRIMADWIADMKKNGLVVPEEVHFATLDYKTLGESAPGEFAEFPVGDSPEVKKPEPVKQVKYTQGQVVYMPVTVHHQKGNDCMVEYPWNDRRYISARYLLTKDMIKKEEE